MANVVEKKRKELGLSQDEFAAQIGISRQYYSEIESGKRTPSVNLAKEIGSALKISWTIFFEDEVNK